MKVENISSTQKFKPYSKTIRITIESKLEEQAVNYISNHCADIELCDRFKIELHNSQVLEMSPDESKTATRLVKHILDNL